MESEPAREANSSMTRVPAPTAWPMITALGIAMGFAGLLTSPVVSWVGAIFLIAGAVGWFSDVIPQERHETVALLPAPPPPIPVRPEVAQLHVGEQGHRAMLPLEIYPYSAGIKGGIAGGVVMAALAVIFSVVEYGTPWYTINILAGAAMPRLAHASTASLASFDIQALMVAVTIHGAVSLLVGLLYGVMLPVLPRNPVFFGGVIAPVIWTGLLWASLRVINPVLAARIDWIWFIVCQVGFGLTAGLVVARSVRIHTFQHLPVAMRMGIEARGVRPPRERE